MGGDGDLLCFEDFPEGSTWDLGSWTVTEEEIVAFATDWDPQFFHTDPVAAVDGPFGGLVASGWHTGSIWMRLYADAVLNRAVGMGGGGLDEIRWLVPTRPGDVLTGTLTVTRAHPSGHRPERGTVFFESRLVNQDGGVAVQLSGRGYLAPQEPGRVTGDRLHWEDFHAGQEIELGERSLSVDEIVAFGRQWDPQFFHTDPVAAVDGPFGGLVASGWHTASLWVRMFVDEVLSRAVALGGPGVEGMRFHRPTRPGMPLRCRLLVHEAVPSSKRADRGTIVAEAEIRDASDGELVMSFRFRTYLARRDPAA